MSHGLKRKHRKNSIRLFVPICGKHGTVLVFKERGFICPECRKENKRR